MGADAVELDVRRSADGVLVIHHDARAATDAVIVETGVAGPPGVRADARRGARRGAGVWVNIEIKNDEREPDFDPDDHVAIEVLAELAEREPGRLADLQLPPADWSTAAACRPVGADRRT